METSQLESVLIQLRRLHHHGGVPVSLHGTRDWYEVMLFPPAVDAQIARAQERLDKRLPEDFLHFWRFTNGANLFVNESGLHGIGVASTDLIVELERDEVEAYGLAVLREHVVFARVNGAGDFLAFNLRNGAVVDGVHSEQPSEWKEIAPNFTAWLQRLVEMDGRYYWIEALYEAAPADG